ncbi:MAG TPA: amino acid adenylation domain-containing protein [Pseudonocardiaceae bacterium]
MSSIRSLPWLDPRAPIHRLVTAQAARTPDATAVVATGRDGRAAELTYAELDARSAALAAALRSAGAGPGAPVGICLPRTAGLVVAVLAALRAGAGYLPLDPAYPADRVHLVLDDSRAPLVITDRATAGLLDGSGATPLLLEDLPAWPVDVADEPGVTLDDRAYVIYTSGSTGRPKGVEVPHRGVNALLRWAAATYQPHEPAGVLFATSVCFDISVFELFFPLAVGGTVIVAENVLELPELPARDRVTLVNTVPSAMAALLRAGSLPESVTVVNLAGEPLPRRLADRVYAEPRVRRLFNLYGPTEDTVYSTWCLVAPDDTAEPSIGVPLPGSTGHVLDEARRAVPDGAVGELYLAGEGLAIGYLGRPDLTAERFVAVGGTRMYRTGDLVRRLPDGRLEYHGRTDHQVKVRGFRVELGEIEAVLARLPGVQLAAAVARDDADGGGRHLAGFVQADPAVVTPAALREHLSAALPAYMVPSALAVLPELPLTPNGKVDRRALPEIERVRDDSTAFVAPRTELEEDLAGIWCEVLGVDRVGVHDVFLDLGGHSLLAAGTLSRVERRFGVRVGLAEFFAAPTIAALATRINATPPPPGGDEAAADAVLPMREPVAPPATAAIQREFWVGERLHQGPTAMFNVGIRVRALGTLDTDRLAAAITAVVARNEVLRTAVTAVDGQPVPVVMPPYPVPLAVVDLTGHAGDVTAELDGVLRAEAALPMSLESGQLLRALAVRLAPEHHELLVTVHHAAIDGWSIGLLIEEIGAVYGGELLPEPALQFADVARWEQRVLAADRPRLVEHWTRVLAGVDPQQDLPGDRPGPAGTDLAGDRLARRVDPALLAEAERWARAEGTSLYVVLLAALGALVNRYTGRRDQVVVTPFAVRPHQELERVIGPLLSTIALRYDVAPGDSLRELVHRLRPRVLDAIEHGGLPFTELTVAADAPRELGRAPVSQVMLAVQNHPLPSVALPELTLDFVAEVTAGVSRVPLSLFLEFPVDGPVLTAEYQTAGYDRPTVQTLLDHLLTLLAAGLAEPDRPLAELPMLAAHELPAQPARTAYPPRTVPELVALSALAHPGRTAVSCASGSLGYGELDAQANRLAHHLLALGAGPGRPVGVALGRSSRLLVALLAVMRTGAPYLPVDPDHPAARTELVLADAGVELVVTESAVRDGLPGAHVVLDHLDLSGYPAGDPGVRLDPAGTAYVLYTSGSTGRPKGVAVPHRALVNFLTSMAARPGVHATDTVAALTTLTFDIAGLELWLPLLAGARVAVADRATASDGLALARWLDEQGVTVVQATPATWRMLLAAGWTGRPDLRALCGGEALTRELARDLLARTGELWNVYGPTETTIWSTVLRVDEAAAAGDGVVALGEPIANTRVYVLGEGDVPLPANAVGELCIAGDGLADGYLGRPELTAERFVDDPFHPGERMYRTGDLARRRRDGSLEFCGRADHQVKLRGYRIELGEIEAVLAAQPSVADAAVVLHTPANGEPRLVGYVVPAAGEPSDLTAPLAARLPDYMVPGVFVTLDRLPLTPNGKVDRKALPAPEPVTVMGLDHEPPFGDCEEILAEVWIDVLGLSRVDRRDNFFALGGHSLQATRMLARVRDQFEIELPVRAVFEAPTLAGLAARIEKTLLAELELVGEN